MEYPIEIKGKTIKQVTKLNLSNKNLKTIPDNLYQYTNLEKLDLNKNRITSIPKDILKLRKLRTLDLAFNQIKELHSSIFKLPKLRILNLHGNQIEHLPKQLSESNLSTLILSKNNIKVLNKDLVKHISKLDIVDNPISNNAKSEDDNVVIHSKRLPKNNAEKKETSMKEDKKKIFISYAHADENFHDRLMTHLSVLKKYRRL